MARDRPIDLGDFLDQEIYPALFDRLDTAFPEFGWRRNGSRWIATNDAHARSLQGAPRPDRVNAYENTPFGFVVHGSAFTSWPQYLNGERTPSGQDFVHTVRELADRAGVDASGLVHEPTSEQSATIEHRDRREALLAAFVDRARHALLGPDGEAARGYLAGERGFDLADLNELPFGLYTSPERVDATLVEVGFTTDEVADSGLLADARWTGRLVIPWRDRWGRIATIAARSVDESDPKYLYLKGATKPPAFGLDVALAGGRGRDELVLVEGLIDVMSLQTRGLENVAALGGGGELLTPRRWATLLDYAIHRFVLVLDNDPEPEPCDSHGLASCRRCAPGTVGTLAAVENVIKADNVPVVYVVDPEELGDAKDPDEFVRQRGLDAFRKILNKRQTGNVFRAAALLDGVTPDSPDRQEAAIEVLGLAAGLRGPRAALDGEDLLRLASERTGYTRGTLAELAEAQTARRQHEQAARDLDHALRDAQSARRAGHGKTTALVNLLLHWLETNPDEAFVFYSYEVPLEAVLLKLASTLTRELCSEGWTVYQVKDWLQGRDRSDGYPSDPQELAAVWERLRAYEPRVDVVYQPAMTVADLVGHAHRVAEQSNNRVGAVLVDYLQLVPPPPGQFDRRDIEVSTVARALKALAVDLNAPVVAAAQIGRQAAAQGEQIPAGSFGEEHVQTAIRKRRPQLHHLREGGSEQEADLVLGLLNYRADYLQESEDPDLAGREEPGPFEILTLKNRYGDLGLASLILDGRTGTIRDPKPGKEV